MSRWKTTLKNSACARFENDDGQEISIHPPYVDGNYRVYMSGPDGGPFVADGVQQLADDLYELLGRAKAIFLVEGAK